VSPTEQILGINFLNGTVDEAVDSLSSSGGMIVFPSTAT
jgi:hypothetical protein